MVTLAQLRNSLDALLQDDRWNPDESFEDGTRLGDFLRVLNARREIPHPSTGTKREDPQ